MKKSLLLGLILILLLSASCAAKPAGGSTQAATADGSLVTVKLPVGYIPNVQFAPLYVAMEKGYFKEQGIQLDLDYSMENDNAVLLANNTVQFAVLSGEQVLLARDKQMPLVYVAAWYQQYPVGIVVKADSGIKTVADLKGKKIGLPGLYGASYIGAIALLGSAGLKESDVTLDSIGYNQVQLMMANHDDAMVIYVANEPAQLESLGQKITLFKVSDAIDLVGNGLVTNEKTLKDNPQQVKAMIAALLKGIQYTIDHPDEAYDISKKYVDNLASADQEIQKQVLLRSIDEWKTKTMGVSDPQAWVNMEKILTEMKLTTTQVDVNVCYTNELLP